MLLSLVACAAPQEEGEDADTFDLRPTDKDTNAKVSVLALRFDRTSPRNVELRVDGMNASSGAGGVLLQVGVPSGAPVKSAFGACPSSG